jgi:hypothetical protein
MTKSRGILATRQYWTQAEETIVRDLYPDLPCADVAALLGRTTSGVYQAAKRMGLTKSEYFQTSDLSGRVQRGKQHPSMIAAQFKPGLTAWNKGLNYQPGGRCAETQFKPRQPAESANHRPIGSLRITRDGYLEQKMNDDPALVPSRRWVAVHRLVWEAAHGLIPAGHIVTFKPGCKTTELASITIDKLECITRAEHARRNHPRSYSPELARLVQLKGAITRQVNRITKQHQESTST